MILKVIIYCAVPGTRYQVPGGTRYKHEMVSTLTVESEAEAEVISATVPVPGT